MILTKELLHQHGACKSGIDFCERNLLFGFDLDNVHQIEGDYDGMIEWITDTILDNSFEYDHNGNIIYRCPKENNHEYDSPISFAYDANNNNKIEEKYLKDNRWIRWQYDSSNNKIKEEDSNGSWIKYKYDFHNNKIKDEYKGGSWTKYKYDSHNRLLKITTSCGLNAKFKYDTNNNIIYKEGYCGVYYEYTYDDNNNNILEVNSYGDWVKCEYDDRNNLIKKTDISGYISEWEYDDHNNIKFLHTNYRALEDDFNPIIEYYPDGQLKQYHTLIIPYFKKV